MGNFWFCCTFVFFYFVSVFLTSVPLVEYMLKLEFTQTKNRCVESMGLWLILESSLSEKWSFIKCVKKEQREEPEVRWMKGP